MTHIGSIAVEGVVQIGGVSRPGCGIVGIEIGVEVVWSTKLTSLT
jgi:hypothetical protein